MPAMPIICRTYAVFKGARKDVDRARDLPGATGAAVAPSPLPQVGDEVGVVVGNGLLVEHPGNLPTGLGVCCAAAAGVGNLLGKTCGTEAGDNGVNLRIQRGTMGAPGIESRDPKYVVPGRSASSRCSLKIAASRSFTCALYHVIVVRIE